MATLNTLRTRGALFLSIVIGLALIAFLLGDLTSASSVFQSRRNRVGSVDGNNIDYMDFVAEDNRISQVYQMISGRSSLSAAETDQVREMVWQSYVRRYAYEPGYRRMGLAVGEAEQVDMVQGRYISPVVNSLFADPQTGQIDRVGMAEFIASLDADVSGGRAPELWNYAKSEMVTERQTAKFLALVAAGQWVNDLEVERGVAGANNNYTGSWAQLPYLGVADSLATASSSDIRSYYDAHKDNFRRPASRDIEYVVFNLDPSESDYADAATYVETLAADFAAAEDPMQFASLNSQERTSTIYFGEDQLSPENAAIAFGDRRGEMAGPTLAGNVYTMTRVANVRMMPDSVGARQITLPLTDGVRADSVAGAIRGGADILALAATYSMDPTVDLGVFRPEMMIEPIANALIAARVGEVFVVDSQFGKHVVQMTYKSPVVQKAQIATITYTVEPSATTEQTAYNGARDFLGAAAGSREKFDAAVTAQGVNRRVATISGSEHEVTGLTNSRELARWSFNTKPGTVSPIFDIDGDYVVAVVTDAKEAGIAPVGDVSSAIAQRLLTKNKGAILSARMDGKSVEEIAAMADAKTGEFADLKPNAYYEPTMGVEPGVIGSLESLAAGTVSKPVEGYSGVYVVRVASIAQVSDATNESERVRLEANTETSLAERVGAAMVSGVDVVDNRARFF